MSFHPVKALGSLIALVAIMATMSQASDNLANLDKEHVVPDAMETKPKASIKVEWPHEKVHAEQGNELKPSQVKELPKISYDHKDDKLYTLMMIDLDAPSRMNPQFRDFLHFLAVNIPGDHLEKGTTLVEYIGAGPPKDTGLHRYVFMVYQQEDKISDNLKVSKTTLTGRPKFSARKFAKEHKLGDPVAANFFKAQYDDYVPTLHAQLH